MPPTEAPPTEIPSAEPPAATRSPQRPSPEPTNRTDLDDLLSQIAEGETAEAPGLDSALTDPRDLERPKDTGVVIESTGAIDFDPEFASFGQRAIGAIIDFGVTLAAIAPGAFLTLRLSGAGRILGVVVGVIGLLIAARWYAAALSKRGQWVGNRITGTTVVDVSSGNLLAVGHATTRFIIRAVVSPLFLFGFIMAFTNSQRRTFHDQFASSIVTRPARASWSVDDIEPLADAPD